MSATECDGFARVVVLEMTAGIATNEIDLKSHGHQLEIRTRDSYEVGTRQVWVKVHKSHLQYLDTTEAGKSQLPFIGIT